ncbi:carbamoyltransferase [Streptomyces sp. Ag109_G2-6]|uniref:carbamoyltransferase family protein n=1 Tax=Streptomyces TaxID=1883 RepID=UPI0009A4739F|nr:MULTISPECIES: carbamoyltransferase C-terminal domain-containing protein [Streptomyces]RPF44211.1 carbamoyltransferase [Streptomyces sp. Ag109_G2-6]
MRVLGVNGWPGASHDGAACLVVDGDVIALAEEERFTRHKHAYGEAPLNAAAYCLAEGGLTLDDIDVVAHGWDLPALFADRGLEWFGSDAEALEHLLPKKLFPRSADPRLTFVGHHIAHAASAYHLSGRDRGAILVLDGQGENESTTLAVGIDGEIKKLRAHTPGWSLGYFYAAVCAYAGLGADNAGKMMGLASYGTPGDLTFGGAFDFTDEDFTIGVVPPDLRSTGSTDEEAATIRHWLEHLERALPDAPNRSTRRFDPVTGRFAKATARDPFAYRDVAATAQAALERAVMGLVRGLLRETGETTLMIAGGVGFNATLNGKIMRMPEVRDLFVQPLAGDQGVSLGAAVWAAAQEGDRIKPMNGSVAWGPQWSPDRIRHVLEASGTAYTEPSDIAAATAEVLAAGGVAGWFQGRAEGGPRALGHRSLVAVPDPESTRDRVNVRIKDREAWRPFAPSMQEEAAEALIGTATPLPYMIVTTPVTEAGAAAMPAVVHSDRTTRPQTVSAAVDPLYHRLIGEVSRHTGTPVIMNTSFNGRDEPVVCSPGDALATFHRLPLDALALGPFLVRRPAGSLGEADA